MEQLEINVIESFRRAKNDIIDLQRQVIELSSKQEQLMQLIVESKDKESDLYQKVKDLKTTPQQKVKIINKCIEHAFVASKNGKSFHIPECPFAKNIKPMSKITFKSKTTPMNEGYKACDCIKKI